MGTEVTVFFQQRYSQVNENFLKSDHPAVARTKPRLSSPFPVANPAFGSSSPIELPFPTEPYAQSSSPRHPRRDPGVQEVINSFNDYIIPIPDPRPEDVFTGVPSESPARYGSLTADSARVLQILEMQQNSSMCRHFFLSSCVLISRYDTDEDKEKAQTETCFFGPKRSRFAFP